MGIARGLSWVPVLVIGLSVSALIGAVWYVEGPLGLGKEARVPFRIAAEAFLLAAILIALRHGTPIGRWIGTMPAAHRVVFFTLIVGMIAGHFTLNGRTYFPFVAWEIFPFAREEDPVSCPQFLATTASGKSVRLLVEQLFPSIVQFNPPADKDSSAMTDLVHALAKVYNQHHADDPVRRVDLVLISVPLHHPTPPSCEYLKHYAISSDRSN
jgi:hypothetical protein